MEVVRGKLRLNHGAIQRNGDSVEFIVSVLGQQENYTSRFIRHFPSVQSLAFQSQIIKPYQPNEMKVHACFSNGREYVIETHNEPPAIKLREIEAEFPTHVRRVGNFLHYNVNWSTCYDEIPACLRGYGSDWRQSMIQTSFDVVIRCEVNGKEGRSGFDGQSGESAPKVGYAPSRGTDGTDGLRGSQPEDVHMYKKKVGQKYLVWLIHGEQQEKYIVSSKAKVEIKSLGGNGGNGGNGGRGGHGADGSEDYDATSGARGGNGGDGGNAGNGGNVFLYLESNDTLANNNLIVYSHPGKPGKGGSKGKGGVSGIESTTEETSLILGLLGVMVKINVVGSRSGSSGIKGVSRKIDYREISYDENCQMLDAFEVVFL
jgi:hypothetical protein